MAIFWGILGHTSDHAVSTTPFLTAKGLLDGPGDFHGLVSREPDLSRSVLNGSPSFMGHTFEAMMRWGKPHDDMGKNSINLW